MITSYEVGAIFRIVDDASPVIRRVFSEVQNLDRLITTTRANLARLGQVPGLTKLISQLAEVSGELRKISTQGATAARATATAFGPLNAELSAAVTAAQGLASALTASAAAARTIHVPGIAAPGAVAPGGRHRRPGQIHAPSLSAPVPGSHVRLHSSSNAALLGAGMVAYGAYEEAQFEDAAFRAMFTAQAIPKDPAERAARIKQLRDMIQMAHARTGMPIHDIEEATLTGIRQFAGMPWDERMKVMPDLLLYAGAEARLKGAGTTTESAMESLTGLAHMIKQYKPEQIANLASKFAYISTVDPERLQSIERAASYAVPIMQSGLNVDPFETLLLVAAMQRGGARQSKAGTWIRNMAIAAMPGTSLMSRMAYRKHEEALRALGLVDEDHKPTWFTDGRPDMIKLLDIAGAHAANIPLEKRAAYEKQLFGLQGFGGFAMLSDPTVREQVHILMEQMKTFRTGHEFFTQYAQESPGQQFRVAWAETSNLLMDIGSMVLPPLNAGLKVLDDMLKRIKDTVPHLDTKSKEIAGTALVGSIIGGGIGSFIPGVGTLVGAGAGALIGGGLAAGRGTDWSTIAKVATVGPLGPAAAYLMSVGKLLSPSGAPIAPAIAPPAIGPSGALAAPGSVASVQGTSVTVHATVKAETDNPEALAQKIASMLSAMIAKASQHNLGPGDGVLASPYTSGAGLP